MPRLKFYIVDVFAEEKYAGNQLAVFTEAADLSSDEMQRIAQEINYSETTFILSSQPKAEGYDVRIFTPAQELPFAGHPTLGTAFILQQAILQQPIASVNLNLKVGQIPVTLLYKDNALDILWMRQNSPEFGEIISTDAIAPILNLQPSDIHPTFPVQAVSTGIPFLIVPLQTLAALQKIKVNQAALFALVNSLEAKQILVFCPETRSTENQLSVRVFCDALGILEDPATGSANGCLAGYLSQHSYFGHPSIDIRVEQGYEMGRPSLLLLKTEVKDGTIAVSVGGKVILVAEGEFV